MSHSKHVGRRIGKLTVTRVAYVGETPSGAYVQYLEAQCDCGNARVFCSSQIKHVRACHECSKPRNLYTHPLYRAWRAMITRCHSPQSSQYKNYGARGITVCDRWRLGGAHEGFANFLADMGDRPPGASIDREDNDGPYSPENCRWSDPATQQNNKRNNVRLRLGDQVMTLTQWARHLGVPTSRIEYARHLGLPDAEILQKLVDADGAKVKWTVERKPYTRRAPAKPRPHKPSARQLQRQEDIRRKMELVNMLLDDA